MKCAHNKICKMDLVLFLSSLRIFWYKIISFDLKVASQTDIISLPDLNGLLALIPLNFVTFWQFASQNFNLSNLFFELVKLLQCTPYRLILIKLVMQNSHTSHVNTVNSISDKKFSNLYTRLCKSFNFIFFFVGISKIFFKVYFKISI